ncbi:deoxyuridine 5'-triphosphate nucleotidohydrolase [Erysipelotrichaceae bacterium OH741_COT-311]|nr:deoxyuridine 5'-triphosphate nucleotidohydrolase [Erysipelotrichaceae bacterium OH741_COT-311]
MHKIARFEKVSLAQFTNDLTPTIDVSCYQEIILPTRATTGSAGYDFKAPYAFTLKPKETIKLVTGIRCFIEPGWFLAIFPRSGLGFKYRLQLDNTVGIIDSDYYHANNEGHIMIKITNHSDSILNIQQGEGFAQGIFIPFGICMDDEVSEKRIGGFGSTNKEKL